jgi:DNA-binding NarL/FixJ family response regulator
MRTRVILADDNSLVRKRLKALLQDRGFNVVGQAGDGTTALQLAESIHPEVAILDIAMPHLNGIQAAREIRRTSPRTKSLLLTISGQSQYVLEALRSGVRGYVWKSHAASDLARAVEEVARGGIFFSPVVCQAVMDACVCGTESSGIRLTEVDWRMVHLVAEGKKVREIASLTGITVSNLQWRWNSITKKLDRDRRPDFRSKPLAVDDKPRTSG